MKNSNIPLYAPQNYYAEDKFLQKLVHYFVSTEEQSWMKDYFENMGELSAQKISALSKIADLKRPEHVPYDAVGNRIDEIVYDASYREMEKLVYEFGIVGLGESKEFKSQNKIYSPLLKFALGYLFSQSGSVLYCPICMTDGTLQVLKKHASDELKNKWIPRITSMQIENFYDGAMYLTEIQGGSDVGSNTCEAKLEKGEWRLWGEKWFCSNVGSKTALVLARPEGAVPGTRGLGMFLLPRDLESGERNHIQVNRIKNKLGTCEMATGEIVLEGSVAYPVGDLSKGFAYMTDMLNLSRTYNAIWSVGIARRAYLEAKDYANGRMAFGKKIIEYPLVAHTLQKMEEEVSKNLGLVFEMLSFSDKVERGTGSAEDELMIRFYTPIVKFFTAEKAIEAAHKAIEIFGGNGCVEDFVVAKILRDAQILAIWEGTANILSLDLLRVIKKTEALSVFKKNMNEQLNSIIAIRESQLQKNWVSLQAEIEDLVQGKDGFGGELACKQVAWNIASFVQDLVYQKIMNS